MWPMAQNIKANKFKCDHYALNARLKVQFLVTLSRCRSWTSCRSLCYCVTVGYILVYALLHVPWGWPRSTNVLEYITCLSYVFNSLHLNAYVFFIHIDDIESAIEYIVSIGRRLWRPQRGQIVLPATTFITILNVVWRPLHPELCRKHIGQGVHLTWSVLQLTPWQATVLFYPLMYINSHLRSPYTSMVLPDAWVQ